MASGDAHTADQLLLEASYSGFYFEDLDVVSEALLLGFVNHVASGATDPYPPLEAAANWAQSKSRLALGHQAPTRSGAGIRPAPVSSNLRPQSWKTPAGGWET